ncbi:MAG: ribonuclease H-like domain-containing protein [Rickettsiales bacterium]
MTNTLHIGDLPADIILNGNIAVDTEAMGLNNKRDRLCVVQLSDGSGDAHLVQFKVGEYNAPNLIKLLTDSKRIKIFHFARFDLAIMHHYLGIKLNNIYCTRTASRLVRTYSDKHGYKDICKELIGVDVSKQQQSSYWGANALTNEQIDYAASDVLHLHKLKAKLDEMLERENRTELANAIFNFLPYRAELDLAGWENEDIFAHS